jgi:hypothetical protein
MIHLLPRHSSGVDNGAKASLAALIPGKAGAHRQEPPQHRLVLRPNLGQGFNVDLGNHQKMHGRRRMEIVEGQHLVVLVQLADGNFSPSDTAENAVAHRQTAGSGASAGLFLVDAGNALAAPEFGQHVVHRQAEMGQQNQGMEP